MPSPSSKFLTNKCVATPSKKVKKIGLFTQNDKSVLRITVHFSLLRFCMTEKYKKWQCAYSRLSLKIVAARKQGWQHRNADGAVGYLMHARSPDGAPNMEKQQSMQHETHTFPCVQMRLPRGDSQYGKKKGYVSRPCPFCPGCKSLYLQRVSRQFLNQPMKELAYLVAREYVIQLITYCALCRMQYSFHFSLFFHLFFCPARLHMGQTVRIKDQYQIRCDKIDTAKRRQITGQLSTPGEQLEVKTLNVPSCTLDYIFARGFCYIHRGYGRARRDDACGTKGSIGRRTSTRKKHFQKKVSKDQQTPSQREQTLSIDHRDYQLP